MIFIHLTVELIFDFVDALCRRVVILRKVMYEKAFFYFYHT